MSDMFRAGEPPAHHTSVLSSGTFSGCKTVLNSWSWSSGVRGAQTLARLLLTVLGCLQGLALGLISSSCLVLHISNLHHQHSHDRTSPQLSSSTAIFSPTSRSTPAPRSLNLLHRFRLLKACLLSLNIRHQHPLVCCLSNSSGRLPQSPSCHPTISVGRPV